jgi:hypothetical protein
MVYGSLKGLKKLAELIVLNTNCGSFCIDLLTLAWVELLVAR